MDGTAIKELQALALDAARPFIGKDGKEYSFHSVHRVMHDPEPTPLILRTLTGFADYVKMNADLVKQHECFVLVDGHDHVGLFSQLNPDSMKRKQFAQAFCKGLEESFRFGNWYPQEEFIIKLQSLFEETPDRKELMAFVSKISLEDALTLEDDGVTQRAVVKSGLSGAIKESKGAPSKVNLRPFRTFNEIWQPTSDFIFRMRKTGSSVSCGLFEAEGEAWKLAATNSIMSKLKDLLSETAIKVIG